MAWHGGRVGAIDTFFFGVASRTIDPDGRGVMSHETRDAQALQLVSGEFNDEFFAGGDVRMGDIVLLVDSDTRVPEDCLSKASGM